MLPWRKLYSSIIDSDKLSRVSDSAFRLYVYLLAAQDDSGDYPWTPMHKRRLMMGTKWSAQETDALVSQLVSDGLLHVSDGLLHVVGGEKLNGWQKSQRRVPFKYEFDPLQAILISDSGASRNVSDMQQDVSDVLLPDKIRVDKKRVDKTYTVAEVSAPTSAQKDTGVPDPVPEWLTVLRKASPYKLTAAKETALIRSVSTLGCAPDRLMSAAESLASQWPYKQHKHIDMTLLSWLRREGNGNGTAQTNGGVLGKAESRLTPANPNADYSGWRKPMGLQGKPVPTVDAPRDTNGAVPVRLLDVPPSPATEPRGKTAGG